MANGLVIAESTFATSMKYDYTPNIMEEASAVSAIYRIPTDGEKYEVQPGESILICDKAINHTVTSGKPFDPEKPDASKGNPNSFDLTKADFEWYDESTNNTTDTDNPDVTNLEKIYCYTASVWMLNQQGNKSYILARLDDDISKDDYLGKYKYDYTYIIPSNGKEMKGSSYKIPNKWVIDAVTLASKDKWKWNTISSTLDAGNASCSVNSADKNHFGKSIRRKKLTTENGRVIFKDTNNSSLDFEISTPKF